MKIHFFTAPFYFAFIWFKVQGSRFRVQGSGFKVQGSRFRALVAASPPQKEANPASLRSAAPSKGRGSRGHSLLPMEGGAPKGRRLDGGSGMKKSGGDRLKCVVCESSAIPISSERIHACVEKQYLRQSLPRVGKVASGASRIGY